MKSIEVHSASCDIQSYADGDKPSASEECGVGAEVVFTV